MSNNLIEKRKTIENTKDSIITAKVVANWGDPGLLEDSQFDVLSRFVIVSIESSDRIVTKDKWIKMLAVVKRPERLWIDVVGNLTTATDQQRTDNLGNTNVGLSANFSVNTIPTINDPYQIGEVIHIKKLVKPFLLNNQTQDSIFKSVFSIIDNPAYYNSWYNSDAIFSYIQKNNATDKTRLKTVAKANDTGINNYYYPILNKYQYESFILRQNTTDTIMTSVLTQIFQGSWNGAFQVYNAHGGYLFSDNESLSIPIIEYEDVNLGNKQRISSNDCIPLVVCAPTSFPTPKSRSSGTISYNPTIVNITN